MQNVQVQRSVICGEFSWSCVETYTLAADDPLPGPDVVELAKQS